ncbi:MAG: hypothetical protein HY553_00675, partial [Elusimicrobia bacterium]|nr:hypothetical protein [Elusimicrobiota bacterium]
VGVGAGIKDGPVLQTMLWGSGGAVAGSLAGPAGAVIGAAAGAVVGFLIGVFVVPRQTAVSSGATHQMRL